VLATLYFYFLFRFDYTVVVEKVPVLSPYYGRVTVHHFN